MSAQDERYSLILTQRTKIYAITRDTIFNDQTLVFQRMTMVYIKYEIVTTFVYYLHGHLLK